MCMGCCSRLDDKRLFRSFLEDMLVLATGFLILQVQLAMESAVVLQLLVMVSCGSVNR